MIKSNELRQGNLFSGMGMVQTVLEIIDNTDRGRIIQKGYEVLIVPKENRNQYKPVEIDGIKITIDWLRNFGFTLDMGGHWILKDEPLFSVILMTGENGLEWNHIWDGALTGSPCKYIHQLQNLYFALIGKELQLISK